jgi:uncharacterized protein
MICIELSFTDDPVRLDARPAHRRRLEDLYSQGVLVAAGPWDDDSGALLVFDIERAEVEAVMGADPYFATPGVKVVSVRTWRPVVGPGGGSRP